MKYKKKRWTDEEINILENMYNEDKKVLMSELPDRSWKSITHQIKRRELPREQEYYRYTEEEDSVLKSFYELPKEELMEKLPNRSWESIIQRCTALDLDRPKSWTLWSEEEKRALEGARSLEEAIDILPNRNQNMIKSMITKMGLNIESEKWWEEWEDEYIIDNYSEISDVNDMLKVLSSRTLSSLYNRAFKLGVSRGNDNKEISDSEIIELYESGLYVSQVAREMGITPHTVKYRLNRNGIFPEPMVLTGPDAPAWKGGLTDENVRLRGRAEYREWREKVYERDNYTCVRCKDDRGGNLHAHHIKNFSNQVESRYDVSNGVTLCDTCHNVGPNSFHMKYGTRNNTLEQLIEHIESYDPDEIKRYEDLQELAELADIADEM